MDIVASSTPTRHTPQELVRSKKVPAVESTSRPEVHVTETRDPQRCQQLNALVRRTVAGEFKLAEAAD